MARSVPGEHYRKGFTLTSLFGIALLEVFPGDKTAEAWFAAKRWSGCVACPHCGHDNVQSGAAHATMLYRIRARHKVREMGAEQQMEAMVGDMVGKRFHYDDLVAAGPVGITADPDRSELW